MSIEIKETFFDKAFKQLPKTFSIFHAWFRMNFWSIEFSLHNCKKKQNRWEKPASLYQSHLKDSEFSHIGIWLDPLFSRISSKMVFLYFVILLLCNSSIAVYWQWWFEFVSTLFMFVESRLMMTKFPEFSKPILIWSTGAIF